MRILCLHTAWNETSAGTVRFDLEQFAAVWSSLERLEFSRIVTILMSTSVLIVFVHGLLR